VYLIRHIDHRALSDVYMVAIETLGSIGSPEAVEPLKQALYRGDWWAPVRTRMLREAAAQALRRTKLPEALQVLREAAARGPRGVRLAARAQLRQLGEIS